MSRADELRAKSRRIAARPAGERVEVDSDNAEEMVKPTSTPAAGRSTMPLIVRSRPVRLSVDLAPVEHAGLVAWAAQVGPELGRSRVAAVEPVRVLVRRLLADAELQRSVIEELKRDASSQRR